MLWRTTKLTLLNTTTPSRLKSPHSRLLLHQDTICRHNLATFGYHLRVSWHLHHSETPLTSCFPHHHSFVLLLSLVASCAVTVSPHEVRGTPHASNRPGFLGYHSCNSPTACNPSTNFTGSHLKESYLAQPTDIVTDFRTSDCPPGSKPDTPPCHPHLLPVY
jgi:hypothetical protein